MLATHNAICTPDGRRSQLEFDPITPPLSVLPGNFSLKVANFVAKAQFTKVVCLQSPLPRPSNTNRNIATTLFKHQLQHRYNPLLIFGWC